MQSGLATYLLRAAALLVSDVANEVRLAVVSLTAPAVSPAVQVFPAPPVIAQVQKLTAAAAHRPGGPRELPSGVEVRPGQQVESGPREQDGTEVRGGGQGGAGGGPDQAIV